MLNSVSFHKNFKLFYFVLAAIAFVIVVIRAKTTPFTHDETATFYFIVQNGHYMPFYAHLDTNNHILNSMLTHLCYLLLGSSKFVLRIPNLIFFFFLLIAVYRISKNLSNGFAKVLLVAGFIFSYNWFTFFSVSRGYGISFASMLMAVSFLIDCFKNGKLKHLVLLCFWMQLAMAASLIMMPVFCLMLGLIFIHQLLNSKFFTTANILNLLLNGALIYYWVKYSSHLKELNGLTHGAGNSYWHVTFETLIYMVTGSYSQVLQAVLVVISVLLIAIGLFVLVKSRPNINRIINEAYVYFLFLFVGEVIAIYLMKKVMGVNYPEDRTALFFYITLVLYFVFLVEKLNVTLLNYFSLLISISFLIHFVLKLNFRKQELYIYDTFPPRFYEKLLVEQKNQKIPITIGGHRCREFIYGFMNYRSDGALNPMDAPELLHMNADYLVAKAGEKPFYEKFYDEIDAENDWGFRLLKRKVKIENKLQFELKDKRINGNGEFYEFINDTNNYLFPNKNPVRVDFSFKVNSVPVPFEAWLVVQIDSVNGNKHCFKRSALNWVKLNYNNEKEYTYSVLTPGLPSKYACFKAFLWNIKGKEIDINFTSIKFYQLYAPGINYKAPIYF